MAGRYQGSANEYRNLKVDLFDDEVLVFTPRAMSSTCPPGGALDFAYRIHTDIGNTYFTGAGQQQISALDYELKTGDIVEIITQKGTTPSRTGSRR